MKILNSTKREIYATKEILQQWGCLKGLTASERIRISQQLNQIAASAVNDYKNAINELGTNVYANLTQ